MTQAYMTEPLHVEGTSRFVSTSNAEIHFNYVDGPQDAVPLIFTHGGGPGATSWNNFLYNARALSAGRRCYFLDLPQYGQSSMTPINGPIFTKQAQTISDFMDAMKIESAHFVNQSYGGGAAIVLAASQPTKVASLILISCQPIFGGVVAPTAIVMKRSAGIVSDYYLNTGGPSIEKMRTLLSDLEYRDASRLTDLTVQLRYQASLNPALIKLVQTPGANGEFESLMHLFPQVKAPALILCGAYDWFGGPDVGLLMLNQFQNARLLVISDAGHHPQSELPKEFNAHALAFLNNQ
ncbi:alpha/beta fold hydrolase [Herbaspirillum robiniae]|uniref:alpha/beta fold hydrolase n=1 Tax=Herbaspirillum robiniae TaxID=2014887 RepID=UPI003D77A88E